MNNMIRDYAVNVDGNDFRTCPAYPSVFFCTIPYHTMPCCSIDITVCKTDKLSFDLTDHIIIFGIILMDT